MSTETKAVFGFIVLRHVRDAKTNRYWNHCLKLIRTFYSPNIKIVVIDDNSRYEFVQATQSHENVEIIQSEYPARGELLPYLYFLKYAWFKNAVILHDSVFIHQWLPFHRMKNRVLPLWYFEYDAERLPNLVRIAQYLDNNNELIKLLRAPIRLSTDRSMCFGNICFIQWSFLQEIETKYQISRLVDAILTREDRCALERIMGHLFCMEDPDAKIRRSFFGRVHLHFRSFGYTYDQYMLDFNRHLIVSPVVKVWTGR